MQHDKLNYMYGGSFLLKWKIWKIVCAHDINKKVHYELFLLINFLFFLQQRYQREIDKLERDNRELRKQVIILKGDSMPTPRKIKVTRNVYFKITANLQECWAQIILFCESQIIVLRTYVI